MSTYPPWEAAGEQIRKWLENASEPGCPIAKTTLTLDTLPPSREDWDINSDPEHLDPTHYEWLNRVGIPTEEDQNCSSDQSVYQGTMVMKRDGYLTSWVGMTGPDVLFINNVERDRRSNDPHISELTYAVFTEHFQLKELKHIWVTDIANEDTTKFMNEHIFTPGTEAGMEAASYPPDKIFTWKPSDPEFNALLGTALGKTVGYFMLGAYGQDI